MFLYCATPIIVLMLAVIFLRRSEGLTRGAKLLYLLIFWLEIPGSFVRGGVSVFVFAAALTPLWLIFATITGISWLISYLGGHPAPPLKLALFFFALGGAIVVVLSLIAGFGPLVASLLSMLGLRGGNRETAWEMGGRRLSKTREAARYGPALAHIQSLAKRALKAPAAVFAIDSPLYRAWSVGSTLFMTSGLLKSQHLMSLVARNLYYLESGDARFCLALRRFVIPPAYLLSRFSGHLAPGNLAFSVLAATEGRYTPLLMYMGAFLGALAGGGMGIVITSPLVVRYLRCAQGRANIFATEIGLGNPLADYYEINSYFDFAVPYIYRPLSSTELQIDDIIRWQRGERW
jgi:hypothetical protein